LVLFGFNRAIGFVQLAAPLAKVLLLGKLVGQPKMIENGCVGRSLIEKGRVDLPQCAICRVVERELLVSSEDGDAGREVVERASVSVGHTRKLGTHRLGFRHVDADADTAARDRYAQHVENPSLSGNNGWQATRKDPRASAGLVQFFTRGTVKEFKAAGDDVRA